MVKQAAGSHNNQQLEPGRGFLEVEQKPTWKHVDESLEGKTTRFIPGQVVLLWGAEGGSGAAADGRSVHLEETSLHVSV